MACRQPPEAACAYDGRMSPGDSTAFLTQFDFTAIEEMDPSIGKQLTRMSIKGTTRSTSWPKSGLR